MRMTQYLLAIGQEAQDGGIFGGLTHNERVSLVTGRHSTVGHTNGEDTDG